MTDFIIAILRSGTPLIYVTMAGVIAQCATSSKHHGRKCRSIDEIGQCLRHALWVCV